MDLPCAKVHADVAQMYLDWVWAPHNVGQPPPASKSSVDSAPWAFFLEGGQICVSRRRKHADSSHAGMLVQKTSSSKAVSEETLLPMPLNSSSSGSLPAALY